MPVAIHPPVQSFLDYLKFEKRYSVHTLIAYQNDLTGFFDWLENGMGGMTLQQIDHPILRSWLAELKSDKLSAKSINRKMCSLRSFFKYHLRTGSIQNSPAALLVSQKVSKRLPVFVNEEDVRKLVETLNIASEDWRTLNGKMLITIFYATGMRLSELILLREKQIDWARSQIKVLGKGNKERIIPVSHQLIDGIRDYLKLKKKEFAKPDDYLLVTEKGKKIYPRYAWQLVNRILGEASTLDKKSPHILRHTFATHLMNNGADLSAVKELLGHSSLSATQVYTHTSIDKLKDVHKKAHPRA